MSVCVCVALSLLSLSAIHMPNGMFFFIRERKKNGIEGGKEGERERMKRWKRHAHITEAAQHPVKRDETDGKKKTKKTKEERKRRSARIDTINKSHRSS